MIAIVAQFFGISVLRLAIYGVVAALVTGGALTIRQHYVNKGYASAIKAVKKQDDRAIAAADRVEKKAAQCANTNGYWDVVTQGCKLEDAE